MALAAVSTSRSVVSAFASAGLISTAMRAALGIIWRRSSSRFAATSVTKVDARHVAARTREADTRPSADRVFRDDENDRDGRGCGFGRERRTASPRRDHGDLPADQFGRQGRQAIELALGPAVVDRYVLSLDIAGFLQTLVKSAQRSRTPRAMWRRGNRSPASPPAAPAPPAATPPPRRRAA